MAPGTTHTVNYQRKYKILKRFAKEMVLVCHTEMLFVYGELIVCILLQENGALCDKASEVQHKILIAQEERKFLWKKLMAMQGNTITAGNLEDTLMSNTLSNQTNDGKNLAKKHLLSKSSTSNKTRKTPARPKMRKKAERSLVVEGERPSHPSVNI